MFTQSFEKIAISLPLATKLMVSGSLTRKGVAKGSKGYKLEFGQVEKTLNSKEAKKKMKEFKNFKKTPEFPQFRKYIKDASKAPKNNPEKATAYLSKLDGNSPKETKIVQEHYKKLREM